MHNRRRSWSSLFCTINGQVCAAMNGTNKCHGLIQVILLSATSAEDSLKIYCFFVNKINGVRSNFVPSFHPSDLSSGIPDLLTQIAPISMNKLRELSHLHLSSCQLALYLWTTMSPPLFCCYMGCLRSEYFVLLFFPSRCKGRDVTQLPSTKFRLN